MRPPDAAEIAERLSRYPAGRWRTRDNRVLALAEMTPAHRRNLKRFLETNAERYHRAGFAQEFDRYTPYTGSGEMAEYYANQECPSLSSETPLQWLHQQPLYQSLQHLVQKQPQTLKEEA